MQKTTFLIAGERHFSQNQLWLDGKEIFPEKSQAVHNHSPDGFEWGYLGSGPAQTALALCLEIIDPVLAVKFYQAFKNSFVAEWREDSFSIVIDIKAFLEEQILLDNLFE